ncbi:32119_t:CDS:2 [Gigaspora margarita]|uniref:32119_t:CDS:1 n=1 Tax=Gigaspora margarita TaxID=4874 RepID=A0ABN7WTS3_GIGMA|nr:32119_t:CDS:2 [Gigaspora margarita]
MHAQKNGSKDLSEINALRELNSKLVVIITELRKENAEIPELRREVAEFKKKYTEIEAECINLRQIIRDSSRQIDQSSNTTSNELQTEDAPVSDITDITSNSNAQITDHQLSGEVIPEVSIPSTSISKNTALRKSEISTGAPSQNSHRKKGAENIVQLIADGIRDDVQSGVKTTPCDEISTRAPCQNSSTVGVNNIKYITTYTANTISELTNDKIQEIIDNFSKQVPKESHESPTPEISTGAPRQNYAVKILTNVSIPTESQVSDSSSSKPSQENDQDSELPEAEVNASTEETESRVSDSANSETEVNISNKSRPPISVLPNDPEEKQKHVIKMVLEQFRNLSLKYSIGDNDYFDCLVPCPLCNKDHKKENIRNCIEGEWGSGDYVNTKTYRLSCWGNKYQNSIQIVTVKA